MTFEIGTIPNQRRQAKHTAMSESIRSRRVKLHCRNKQRTICGEVFSLSGELLRLATGGQSFWSCVVSAFATSSCDIASEPRISSDELYIGLLMFGSGGSRSLVVALIAEAILTKEVRKDHELKQKRQSGTTK